MKPEFESFRLRHEAEWTPCQQEAWQRLAPLFDLDQNVQVGLLRGYAGTGKTHWVAQVVHFLETIGWRVRVLTPTGRAAQVIADRMAPYEVEAKPQTIHSCIYEIQPPDYSNAQLELFADTRVLGADEPTFVVVDEGSMVGDAKRSPQAKAGSFNFGSGSLLHDLIESMDLATRPTVRMLFVGDAAQLPPVGGSTEDTPALTREGVERVLQELGCEGALVEAELRSVVRQNEGTLKQFVTSVREVMDSGEDLPRKAVDDVRPILSSDLMAAYLRETKEGEDPERAVILAHSNRDVYDYNIQVRAAMKRNDQRIMPGEVLLVKRNVVLQDFGELEISNVLASLKNGTFVEVVDQPFLRRTHEVKLRGEGVRLDFWSARIRILTTEKESDVLMLANYLDPLLWSGSPSQRLHLQSLLESAVLVDFQQRMLREKGWKPAKPRDAHYEEYNRAARTDRYLNALRIAYGYAVTVHNAQGGEWPVVFVDPASNKAREWQHAPRHKLSFARWVYTASTRARQQLYFIRHSEALATESLP